jgi:hypothetical protein
MFVYRQRASLVLVLDRIGAGARASGVVQCSFHRRQIGADRRSASTCSTVCRSSSTVPGEQAQLDQDANWRYGAFATNLPAGTGPVPRCPSPHPSPRRGQDERGQGLRCRTPAQQRLSPQQRLAADRGPGRQPARLTTPHRVRRRPRQSRTQDAALPDLLRSRPPPRHPCPQEDPENPTRAGPGPPTGNASTPCTQPEPATPVSATAQPRPARKTGAHPSTPGITPCPPTTESATGASTTDDHDPWHRRESSGNEQ